MANALHTFLHQGNIQARDVLGELFNYGSQTGLTGTFTPTDERLAFELTGYMEELDLVLTVDLDQFTTGNEPAVKTPLLKDGNLYTVRTLKTDQSAYVLGLKKIDGVVGATIQLFDVDLAQGDETKVVTYPTAFAAAPRGLYITLLVPAGGVNFDFAVSDPSRTAAGFTAVFGAAVPGPGYKLNVIAYK